MKTKHELEEMTKDELVNYADDHDIDAHHSWLKEDIIAEIMKVEKKAAREEAKQEQSQSQPQPKPTDVPATSYPGEVDPETGVTPEMAEIQRQANQPVDDSTRFASKKPLWDK